MLSRTPIYKVHSLASEITEADRSARDRKKRYLEMKWARKQNIFHLYKARKNHTLRHCPMSGPHQPYN